MEIAAVRKSAMSGLAATLREAEPGTRLRLVLRDGEEVAGKLLSVNGESVTLDGGNSVQLDRVKRLYLEFGAARRRKAAA
jgi:hypothetical protein